MHDVNSVNNRHSNVKHVSCHDELNITFKLKHFNSVAGHFRGIDQTEDQRTFGICASELSIVMFFKHTRRKVTSHMYVVNVKVSLYTVL